MAGSPLDVPGGVLLEGLGIPLEAFALLDTAGSPLDVPGLSVLREGAGPAALLETAGSDELREGVGPLEVVGTELREGRGSPGLLKFAFLETAGSPLDVPGGVLLEGLGIPLEACALLDTAGRPLDVPGAELLDTLGSPLDVPGPREL